jgi:cytochrome c553
MILHKPHPMARQMTGVMAAALTLALSSAAWGQSPAAVGDAAAGAQKTAMCAGCHGILGYKTAFPEVYSVPRIGGQNPAYIVKALQAYKSGERTHPSMRGIAATLSDKDMADLAAYYSAGPSKVAAH